MAYCPNCGSEYAALPQHCQCGYDFGSSTPGRFDFTGDGGALLILYLKLIFFSIFTLGIYSFWGRNAIRKYVWSHIRFAGQPFDYHGTGKELFVGWLKLIGVIIVVYSAAGLLIFSLGRKAEPIIGLLVLGGFALIAPLAIHGALRYRWSRTSWQGRRFAYKGDLMQLATIFLPGLLLTVITLTLYMPIFAMNMRRYIVNNTWYGGQQFQFDGNGSELVWPYAKMLLLIIPTLGLYRFWFQARLNNFSWGHTRFAQVPFKSTMQGGDVLILTITNAILTFFTLGIGAAWATCRTIRYVTENLQLEQLPRVQLLAQSATAASAFGDTLGESLGTDAAIDAGFDAGLGL